MEKRDQFICKCGHSVDNHEYDPTFESKINFSTDDSVGIGEPEAARVCIDDDCECEEFIYNNLCSVCQEREDTILDLEGEVAYCQVCHTIFMLQEGYTQTELGNWVKSIIK